MRKHNWNRRGGFTVLELLVVLAVLALLLALLLPVLQSAKLAGRRAERMVAVRQQYTATQLYAADWNLKYPFFGVPGAPEQGVTFGNCHIPLGEGAAFFTTQSNYWVSAIVPYLSTWRRLPEGAQIEPQIPWSGVQCAGRRDHGWFFGAVKITHTVFADPTYWRDEGPFDSLLTGGTRSTQVRHPSRKGLLIAFPLEEERLSENSADHLFVGFADGSTAVKPWATARNIMPANDPPVNMRNDWPCMATRNGLLGIDY